MYIQYLDWIWFPTLSLKQNIECVGEYFEVRSSLSFTPGGDLQDDRYSHVVGSKNH